MSPELTGIGWEEYLDGETVLIVEWANLVSEALPKKPHGCCWNMKEAACAACLWPSAGMKRISTRCFGKMLCRAGAGPDGIMHGSGESR